MSNYFYRNITNKAGWKTGAFMLENKRKKVREKYSDKIKNGITDEHLWELIKKDEIKETKKNKVRYKH